MHVICALCKSLDSKDGKFLPNTDEAKKHHVRIHFVQSKILRDEITEDEFFRQCFPIHRPNVVQLTLTRSEYRKSLLHQCKSLLKRRPKRAEAVCNMCAFGISIRKGNAYNMVNHACSHLDVELFKCRHCDHSCNNGDNIQKHVRLVHKNKPTTADFHDKTLEHFDEISNWIKRCFSTDHPRACGLQRQYVVSSKSRDTCHRLIVRFCRSIFVQQMKPTNFECSLCGSQIRARGSTGCFQATPVFQHAAAHLEVKLFTCRHCNQSRSSKCGMSVHLKISHQIFNGNSDDFDDQSEKFHSEYLNIIERCFSTDQIKLEVPPVRKLTAKSEANVRTRTGGSILTIERHLFCNRLIRKTVDPDGKIECSLCSKKLVVRLSGHTASQLAFFHAEMHLQKPLYRCDVCRSSFTTQPNLAYHLKAKHALGCAKNHECVADEFHGEIKAMLAKCYGSKGS